MSVINYEKLSTSIRGLQVLRWPNMANGDTGQPYEVAPWSDRSVQLVGTLGTGGELTVEGSNFITTPTWATLVDPQGNALTMAALGIEQILDNVFQLRPSISNGDGSTLLSVYLLLSARIFEGRI